MPQLKKNTPSKICKKCGKTFNRRRYSNRLEDYTRYMKRLYCSKSCNYVRPPITSRGAHQTLAREHLKDSCEGCGTSERLEIHHKDEDWKNNSEQNLSTLCRSCHMKLHWSQWRSRGHQGPLRNIEVKQLISTKN
jgi:hypothetical protein